MSTIKQAVAEGIILGMGNPLLDISAVVSTDVLEQYGLEANSAILAEEKHLPLYEQLSTTEGVQYIAGGATQNAIRVAQWMLQSDNATSFFGSVGDDAYGKTMQACCEKDNVNVQYRVDSETPTGTCAVVVTGTNRSLVANLSAANMYNIEHLMEKEQWTVVEKASLFYIAGFFLTASTDSILAVGKHAAAEGKTMMFNLSAPFLMQVPPFLESMKKILPYVDVLFGNETEAGTMSQVMEWGTEDVKEIAKKLAQWEKTTDRPRTVVITQGSNPTIVVVTDSKGVQSVTEYAVNAIKTEDIVDTNGAGDAFAGGFIAGMAKGLPIEETISYANYASTTIIKQSGCVCPGKPTITL